jgi:recombination protein RecA
VAPPFKESEFDIMYGKGISREGDLLDLAINNNIIQKAGTWFSYGDERLGQGRENVKKLIEDSPDLLVEIEKKVKEVLGMIEKTEVKEKE